MIDIEAYNKMMKEYLDITSKELRKSLVITYTGAEFLNNMTTDEEVDKDRLIKSLGRKIRKLKEDVKWARKTRNRLGRSNRQLASKLKRIQILL